MARARNPAPQTNDEAPRWRVMEKSFVDHALLDEGAEVTFTPEAGDDGRMTQVGNNLSPLNDAAQAIVDAQADDHEDQTDKVPVKGVKAKADAAAAAPHKAAKPATATGGATGDDLA